MRHGLFRQIGVIMCFNKVVPQLMAMAQGGMEEKWNTAQVNSFLVEVLCDLRAPKNLKPLCQIFIIVCVTRTLPATDGRLDGEEDMVAASAGEVQGEGKISFFPSYSVSNDYF